MNKKKIGAFVIFAAVPLIAFITVVIIPFIIGVYMTLTNSSGVNISNEFIGLKNYISAFNDSQFWGSMLLTVKYTFFSLIFTNLIAFILALLVTSGFKGQDFFRLGFFTPNLIGGVILGFIWQFIFSKIFVYIGTTLNIDFLDRKSVV